MTRIEVHNSLFELGDIWTPDIDTYQYVVFFEVLTKLVKEEEADAGKVLQQNPYEIIV